MVSTGPVLIAAGLAMTASIATAAVPTDAVARVDRIFEKYETTESPGCSVAVAEGGKTVLARAYGMSDLERETPNTADTVFEAGSVSKQFTAAGWPRGSRVHTHGHVLEVLSRQKSLNFPSGTEYSYSNSGYNLAAILVTRVAGKPFAEFTRERIFAPLGMTRTEWRDDYTRIVKGRATAYSKAEPGWRTAMPFENVHGNGGLLTTVADLLRWNAALDAGTLAGPEFAAAQQKTAALSDGRPIRYAMGLFAETWKGAREISHGGATAGYRAVLQRYPDHGLSVAVLCNADNANAGSLGHQVADVFLEGTTPEPARTPAPVPPDVLASRAGLYRHPRTMDVLKLDVVDGILKVDGRAALIPISDRLFAVEPFPAIRLEFEVDANGRTTAMSWVDADGAQRHDRVSPAVLNPERRRGYAGRFVSPEADANVTVTVEGDELVVHQGPDWTGKMVAADADVFTVAGAGTFAFDRARNGAVTGRRFYSGRLRGLRFDRQDAGKETRR